MELKLSDVLYIPDELAPYDAEASADILKKILAALAEPPEAG